MMSSWKPRGWAKCALRQKNSKRPPGVSFKEDRAAVAAFRENAPPMKASDVKERKLLPVEWLYDECGPLAKKGIEGFRNRLFAQVILQCVARD